MAGFPHSRVHVTELLVVVRGHRCGGLVVEIIPQTSRKRRHSWTNPAKKFRVYTGFAANPKARFPRTRHAVRHMATIWAGLHRSLTKFRRQNATDDFCNAPSIVGNICADEDKTTFLRKAESREFKRNWEKLREFERI